MLHKTLLVRIRTSLHIVPLEEILYMEKFLRQIVVYTEKGAYTYYARFEDVIPSLDIRFFRCHRSYIVNLERITYLGDMNVKMDDESELMLSNNTIIRIRRQFEKYDRWKKNWLKDNDIMMSTVL